MVSVAVAPAVAVNSSNKVIVADPSRGIKVNAAVVAEPFRQEIKARVQQLKEHGIGALGLLVSTNVTFSG
jgi:hypothetical protein